MSSKLMDENSAAAISDNENNHEDYNKTCNNEIYDVFPILERLNINDDDLMHEQSGFSTDLIPSSTQNVEESSIVDSNNIVSTVFVRDMLDLVRLKEDTKAMVGNQKSIFGAEETQQVYFTNTTEIFEKTSEGREIFEKEIKILNTSKETKLTALEIAVFKESLNLLNDNLARNSKASSTSAVSESETGFSMIASKEKNCIDPETGEIVKKSNINLQGTSGSNILQKALDQSSQGMAGGAESDFDSSKLSCFTDSQSSDSSGIMVDSPPDYLQTGAEKASSSTRKRSRKTIVFESPVSEMIEIKKRRFGIFQSSSNVNNALKTNSSQEEDSKNSRPIGRQNPRNSRQKCKKPAKFSPGRIAQNYLSAEERRPSPCKRKKSTSENMTEATEKFRKRSISELNSETGENTHLVIRSRSLSPGLNKINCTSKKNPHPKNFKKSLLRKRTNSFSHGDTRFKFRKSSTLTSSNDEEKNHF